MFGIIFGSQVLKFDLVSERNSVSTNHSIMIRQCGRDQEWLTQKSKDMPDVFGRRVAGPVVDGML